VPWHPEDDISLFKQGDRIIIPDLRRLVERGEVEIPVMINSTEVYTLRDISDRQLNELLAGGTLNYVKNLKKTVI
jgi:aconitate hydratase